MPTIKYDGDISAHFVFIQIITRFGISKDLDTNHGRHIQNKMMAKLAFKLGYKKEKFYSYYSQANDGVEDVNKYLKAILQKKHLTKQK